MGIDSWDREGECRYGLKNLNPCDAESFYALDRLLELWHLQIIQ
jgi:hypothetical protein